MTSAPLRQLSAIMNGSTKLAGAERLAEECILFHFVPEYLVTNRSFAGSTRSSWGIEAFVASVYNRLRKRVERTIPRQLFTLAAAPVRSSVGAPIFTLARTDSPKFSYTLSWPSSVHDTMDHHTFLHVGYQISQDREWLFAACIDQRGEDHDTGVWRLNHAEGVSFESRVVNNLVEFGLQCARRAKIEWRLVFTKGSPIGEVEMRGTWP
jgi:mediator of RNA polymerase II transcription subunit 13, fungi type